MIIREHKSFKEAFTMIELIFVIIIIGILAAIAIPKLVATRDDAEATKIVNNLATCINIAGTKYVQTTSFGTIITSSIACSTGVQDAVGTACFTYTPTDAAGTFAVATAGTSNACTKAHALATTNGLITTHQF
jgi:general secretion pathway protein G